MASQELGAPAYRKFDVEAWMPGRNSYGEVYCKHCLFSHAVILQLRNVDLDIKRFQLYRFSIASAFGSIQRQRWQFKARSYGKKSLLAIATFKSLLSTVYQNCSRLTCLIAAISPLLSAVGCIPLSAVFSMSFFVKVNGTACATSRLMIALVEQHQKHVSIHEKFFLRFDFSFYLFHRIRA